MEEKIVKYAISDECNEYLKSIDDPEALGNELVDEFLHKIDEIIAKRE